MGRLVVRGLVCGKVSGGRPGVWEGLMGCVNIHEQVTNSLVYTLAGGSTYMSAHL